MRGVRIVALGASLALLVPWFTFLMMSPGERERWLLAGNAALLSIALAAITLVFALDAR